MGTVDVLGLRSSFENILKLLAFILYLGNLEFDDS